jgi:U3 small nucleolar RNA-associated protein 14
MSEVKENGTKVLKSKRFVVRMSLVGKNQVIEFTNKKGDVVTYNHDKVYEVMKEKLNTLPCWTKYKSYTATGNIPMAIRNIELV